MRDVWAMAVCKPGVSAGGDVLGVGDHSKMIGRCCGEDGFNNAIAFAVRQVQCYIDPVAFGNLPVDMATTIRGKRVRRLNLVNISLIDSEYFPPFEVDRYVFHSRTAPTMRRPLTYTSAMMRRSVRQNHPNAYVEFDGCQEDSRLFSGACTIEAFSYRRIRKLKIIEDLLLLGSILTGMNWALESRRSYSNYPTTGSNKLTCVVDSWRELVELLQKISCKIKNPEWLSRFSDGFHLKVLRNNANIQNMEARFLSHTMLWEFMCARLFGPEERIQSKVVPRVINELWPGIVCNEALEKLNVFQMLRNQLTHAGRLPIDRKRAEDWMKEIPVSKFGDDRRSSLVDYMDFFGHLTQIAVLKTLDLDVSEKLQAFDFPKRFRSFVEGGRI